MRYAHSILTAVAVVFAGVSWASDRQVALQDEWYQCLRVFAVTVAERTNEPANTIVDASFAACQEPEDALYDYFAANSEPLRTFLTENLLPSIYSHNRNRVMAEVLAARSAR